MARKLPVRSPEHQFVHNAIEELWYAREHPFEPSADIDVVWAVSSTGTIKQPAELGEANPYSGVLFDKGVVDEAVDLVVAITALRVKKPKDLVTHEDIRKHGPTLLYNGETPGLPHSKFPLQNQHFKELTEQEGFPIPSEKISIGVIDEAHTPAQVKQLGEFLKQLPELPRKIAVICSFSHLTRVGRYLEHNKTVIPSGTELVADPVQVGSDALESRIAALEVGKARAYLKLGHLSTKSIFFPQQVPDSRPRNIASFE